MRKFLLFVLISMVIVFMGCNFQSDSLTIFKIGPFDTNFNVMNIYKAVISRTITLKVLYKNGYVTKTVMSEVNTVKDNPDDINALKMSIESLSEVFNQEVFQVNGFEYNIESTDTSYTLTTIYDYTKMDIKKEMEDDKILLHVTGMIDEDYKIPYEKVKEAYNVIGYTCEETIN